MSTSAHISLPMAIIIGINAIVGASIFLAPAALQVTAGPASLITYGLVSVAALFLALALARVAQLYPEKGAFYTYAKAWGGHVWGTIAMLSYFIGLSIALGLLARVTGFYLNMYISSINPLHLSLILIVILVAANLAGALIAKTGQIILMILTYVPIITLIGLCFAQADVNNLIPFMPNGLTSILQAVPLVIFGFFGIEAIPSLFSEIQNPQQNVPKAVVWTILLVSATYLLFATAIFIGLPRELFASPTTPLSFALLALYPQYTWLVSLIDWAIIITITGVLHSMIWSLSALSVDTSGYILQKQSPLSRSTALLFVGGMVIASCVIFQNINLMFALTALFIIFAYATAIMPLLLNPLGKSPRQITLGILGLLTSALIFGCGILGIIKEIG